MLTLSADKEHFVFIERNGQTVLLVSPEMQEMLLKRAGCRSKRRRIQKKVIKRIITDAIKGTILPVRQKLF